METLLSMSNFAFPKTKLPGRYTTAFGRNIDQAERNTEPTEPKIAEIFKRSKNREDGSDCNDFVDDIDGLDALYLFKNF